MAFIIYANNLKMQIWHDHYMRSTFIKNTFIVLFSLTLLSNCASTSSQKKSVTKTNAIAESQELLNKPVTATQRLNEAQTLPFADKIIALVESAELFIQEKNYTKALWLSNKIVPLIDEETDDKDLLNFRLALIKSESLLAIAEIHQEESSQAVELSYQLLQQQQSYVKQNQNDDKNRLHQIKFYQLLSQTALKKQLVITSVDADLRAFSLSEKTTTDNAQILWNKLIQLSQWQLDQLSKKQAPFIKGWKTLLNYAHQFGSDEKQFSRYLAQWQRKNPTHPANEIVKQMKEVKLIHQVISNIAVILPLTGDQQAAGKTAQQGILAAYDNNEAKTLHFIDSNTLDWSTLNTTLTDLTIDYVIGPLLKSNVDAYLSQEDIIIPSLLLNLPATVNLNSTQVVLSMRPEDEANQAATTLSQNNYKQPLILSHDDNVSKRITQAFTQQWHEITGKNIDVVYFDKGKQIQQNVKSGLDVDSSQERINELKSRLKQTLKTESRNRRDVDMIYVVGSAQQTRLVKPYIDVNTSPFAQVIPVFASSRSHSVKQDNSSSRDLTGLTFTEIPWLLESDFQNKPLAQLSRQLWPKRTGSLQRIFAMGFDSFSLIDKIPLMQQAPYIRHFGQTGVLKLNNNNVLTRSLIWGRYQNSRVQHIVME